MSNLNLYPHQTPHQQLPRSSSLLPQDEYHQPVEPQMLELVDDNDFDMDFPSSPDTHIPLSPDHDSLPSNHGTPPPHSPQPEPFMHRVPPRIKHVFHPTINGMSLFNKYCISYL